MVTRLELYQRMADFSELKQIPFWRRNLMIGSGAAERSGKPAFILKIRALAKDAGIESISNMDGEIIIQLFAGCN